MAEISSPSNEQPAATGRAIKRLWTLTIASLALNGIILCLIVVGAIVHHHRLERGFGDHGQGFRFQDRGPGEWGPRFHRFGGYNWGPRGGFDRGGRFGDNGGPGFGGERWGHGFRGGVGMGRGGPGDSGPEMPSINPGKPDPAKMSEMILNHLSQRLSLTEDEKAKIKPIIDQQIEAQRAAMQKQMQDTKAKIRALLTPDQQKQLDALPLPGQKAQSADGTVPPSKSGP